MKSPEVLLFFCQRFLFSNLAQGAGAWPGEPALRLSSSKSLRLLISLAIFNLLSFAKRGPGIVVYKVSKRLGRVLMELQPSTHGDALGQILNHQLISYVSQIPDTVKWAKCWQTDSARLILVLTAIKF